MFTVALIGPDGAGKTTIATMLEATQGGRIRYVYMGDNLQTSNVMLPTTRLLRDLERRRHGAEAPGASDGTQRRPAASPRARVLSGLKWTVCYANWLAEEYYRDLVAWWLLKRGHVVVFDRHFFLDYYADDIAGNGKGRSWSRRLHARMLDWTHPRPDLVVFLDAPAELLFARKGEFSVAHLERRRQDYLSLRAVFEHFAVVDASQPPDQVMRDVLRCLDDYRTRTQESRGGRSRALGQQPRFS
jgi:thymidylate kinase